MSVSFQLQSEPSWQLLKQFVVQDLQLALQVDSLQSSHAMNTKVLTSTEAVDVFDKITYQKCRCNYDAKIDYHKLPEI